MTKKEKPFGGLIENWMKITIKGLMVDVIMGDLVGDPNDRFPPGSTVRTSPIQREWQDEVGVHFVETRNTIYKLGVPL